MFMFKS